LFEALLIEPFSSSTDPEVIPQGLEYVRDTLSRNCVRADESEKIKSMTREPGTQRIIDGVKVRLVETEDK
jgi:predicted ATP-dependent Lon-type protease